MTPSTSAQSPAQDALLSIRGLRAAFGIEKPVEVLHGVDLDIAPGEIHVLIGESGSGKSVLARSILGLAGSKSRVTGEIRFQGKNLLDFTEDEYEKLRGADIAMIVQDAMAALNPMRTIGEQLAETIRFRHPDFRNPGARRPSGEELESLSLSYLKQVGITAPEKRLISYPHQLSGGMRQRIMIALALIGSPKLLIADEPTTALDVVVQRTLLAQMREIVLSRGMSMLLVTHDLHLAHDVGDRVSVMYAGTILEEGPVDQVIAHPAHPYTKGLLDAMPSMEGESGSFRPIPGEIPPPAQLGAGCPFAGRCALATSECRLRLEPMRSIGPGRVTRCTAAREAHEPQAEVIEQRPVRGPVSAVAMPVVQAQVIKHCYFSRRGFFGRLHPWNVLENIELNINQGEVLGLVGESGCGKSTLARLMLGAQRPTEGSVRFMGEEYPAPRTKTWRSQRPSVQMIYQDPFSCFDARMSIVDQVAEPLQVHRGLSADEAKEKALEVLREAGLPNYHAEKLPGVLSGGQLQRAAIARAIALKPKLLVCDEPVASLDVSIQAQVLELLKKLKAAERMSMLFVSHNLSVVRAVCDRVAVMYLGRVVEVGLAEEIFRHPKHPYTRLLAASTPGADARVIEFYPQGSVPSPMDRPKGCVFAGRCPLAQPACRECMPDLRAVSDRRAVACFAPDGALEALDEKAERRSESHSSQAA